MAYPMDWDNVDLDREYERDCNLLDGLTFAELLLEIDCNIESISSKTITEQFQKDLQEKITAATEIFKANLENILIKSIKTRFSDE